MALVACPFCREMFEKGEHAVCPSCGVALEDFHKLKPSHDALEADAHLDEAQVQSARAAAQGLFAPDEPKLPLTSLGLARGPLLAAIVLGLGAFFLPWIHLTFPWDETKTAYDLSRGRLGWMWGTGCAWFVAIPVVLSRRTPARMRTARVPIAALVLLPLVAMGVLLAFPPTSIGGIKVHFHYGVGAWITCAAAALALGFAARFGVEPRTPQARISTRTDLH